MRRVEDIRILKIEVGNWLRNARHEKGLIIPQLASKSKIDAGTISRLENGITEPTLQTIFQLCTALGIELTSLLKFLTDLFSLSLEAYPEIEKSHTTFNKQDLLDFLNFFKRQEAKAIKLLSENLNVIISKSTGSNIAGSEPLYFAPNILRNFLEPQVCYQFDLKYPRKLKVQEILNTYKGAGVISFKDLSLFIEYLEGKKLTKPSEVFLERMLTEDFARVKFPEIVSISLYTEQASQLIGIVWEAYSTISLEQELQHQQNLTSVAAMRMIIAIVRWMQYLDSPFENWLTTLRNQIRSIK